MCRMFHRGWDVFSCIEYTSAAPKYELDRGDNALSLQKKPGMMLQGSAGELVFTVFEKGFGKAGSFEGLDNSPK